MDLDSGLQRRDRAREGVFFADSFVEMHFTRRATRPCCLSKSLVVSVFTEVAAITTVDGRLFPLPPLPISAASQPPPPPLATLIPFLSLQICPFLESDAVAFWDRLLPLSRCF